MPHIFKPKKKTNYTKRDKSKAIYDTVYNTTAWRKLRAAYLLQHPLCEMCEKQGKITPATDVHHKTEISTAQTPLEMQTLGFDADNLMALCEDCHTRLHAEKHRRV